MQLDDVTISRAIIERYFAKLTDALELEVALAGAGPSNLVAGVLLGEAGVKAALFDATLAPGGGMWGGAMMFNEIVIQRSALALAERLGVRVIPCGSEGYFTADSVETTATLIARCVRAGTPIFNAVTVEDVMFREQQGDKRVSGLVLQWSPVARLGMHVDPLTIRARYVVDGTGHPAEVCSLVARKLDTDLRTRTGKVVGEMSMWAGEGELRTLENADEVYPGLFVTGMAANAARGAPRMGPIFGGMLLSGAKIAEMLVARCDGAGRSS